MLRMLLDIAYPGRPYVRHPRIIIKEPVDSTTVTDSAVNATNGVTDTVVTPATDSLSAVQGVMTDVGNSANDDSTMLLYASLLVVFFALAVCLYFVYAYRRSLQVR